MKTTSRRSLGASLFLAAAGLAPLAVAQPIDPGPPEIILHRTNPHVALAPAKGSTGATSPITYHNNGPVLGDYPNVYLIWYGNWNQTNGTDNAAGQQIVRDFFSAISVGDPNNPNTVSPYMKINTTYSLPGTAISGLVGGVVESTDTGSQGTKLSDSKIKLIVQSAISGMGGTTDGKAVYFVLTSSNVTLTSGFCTRYCGWHTYGTILGTNVKYSFVGNAARCINSCAAQSIGPNGNAGVDGMVSVIAHELVEAVSDPNLNAWYDSSGYENADKCAWTFGQNLSTVSINGATAYYNLTLSYTTPAPTSLTITRNFLIQRNLHHTAAADYCAVAVNADGSLSK